MHVVKPLSLGFREVQPAHGTNLESLVLDAVKNPAGKMPFHRVRLYDGQRPLGHPAIIAGAISRDFEENAVTTTSLPPHADPDIHKGAIEGDRPTDEQQGNPNGGGLDDNGLPNDPVATAEDAIGANEDESQG
jgi:hypothetical protein